MGLFFKKKIETRSETTTEKTVKEADNTLLYQLLTGDVEVSEDVALSIPSFSSAVNFIANTIAMLPIKLYHYSAESEVTEEVTDDYRLKLVNDETGDLLDAYQTKQAMVRDCLLGGAGYVYINRKGNSIKSLHYVDKDYVTVQDGYDPIFKNAAIRVNGKSYLPYDFMILCNSTKDGVTGKSVIDQFKLLLQTTSNNFKLENNVSRTGGNKKGFLLSPKKLDDPAMDRLRTAWENLYNNNNNNMMVLNDGITFQEASATLAESQLNENKQTNSDLVASIFALSTSFLTGKYTDADYQSAIKSAVLPYITAFESILNKNLLLESEKESYYFAVDMSDITKADVKTRYEAYATALNNNILQLDEVRYMENLKPLGVNYIKLGLQDVLYNPEDGTIYTPNTNKTVKLDKTLGGDDNANSSGITG